MFNKCECQRCIALGLTICICSAILSEIIVGHSKLPTHIPHNDSFYLSVFTGTNSITASGLTSTSVGWDMNMGI